MKVLVCGSRDWPLRSAITNRLASLPRGTIIIHGGARGADQMAGQAARKLGFTEVIFPAHWDRHGRKAGVVRNNEMLDEKPDLVLAYWHRSSTGTGHTIDEAKKRGIPIEVYVSGDRPRATLA